MNGSTRYFAAAQLADGSTLPSTCAARRSSCACGRRCASSRPARPSATAAIARQIGAPGASRAVGMANGANPIAIIVPCHRVIGSNGTLTGYGGGLDRKTWLLDHERARSGAHGAFGATINDGTRSRRIASPCFLRFCVLVVNPFSPYRVRHRFRNLAQLPERLAAVADRGFPARPPRPASGRTAGRRRSGRSRSRRRPLAPARSVLRRRRALRTGRVAACASARAHTKRAALPAPRPRVVHQRELLRIRRLLAAVPRRLDARRPPSASISSPESSATVRLAGRGGVIERLQPRVLLEGLPGLLGRRDRPAHRRA